MDISKFTWTREPKSYSVTENKMKKRLRPHHGMCFQFYEGKGYSADFTDHMGKVIKELEADSEQKVVLKAETDIVCENCPNNEGGVCTTQDKVLRYDRGLLTALMSAFIKLCARNQI